MKNKNNISTAHGMALFACVIWLLFIISCTSDNLAELSGNQDCSQNDSLVSFSKDIVPVFTVNCIQSGCHSGAAPQSNLNLEATVAYAQLSRKGRGYIDTLNPKSSVLYAYMVSSNDPMPPTGNLDKCTLLLIETWMKQGAKDN